MGWNPWKHLALAYPHVTVITHQELPDRMWGLRAGDLIWLCRKLNQTRRRCTLAHEIVHLERGITPADPVGQAREERTVSELAARRLITIDHLVDGLRWTQDASELAEHLWVDLPTLRARMASLDPIEVAQLENHLDGRWIP
jgi:hypothetical protein